jgi:hypothetical protein
VDRLKMVAEISLTKACLMVIECLSQERDWKVLKLVLVQVRNLVKSFERLVTSLSSELCALYFENILKFNFWNSKINPNSF